MLSCIEQDLVPLVDGFAAEGNAHLVRCSQQNILDAQAPLPSLAGAADRRYSAALEKRRETQLFRAITTIRQLLGQEGRVVVR